MDPRAYFTTLARYNVWATRRLFETVDALSDTDYRRPCGLFFGSVHGTLNHLLVAEHEAWYPRFAEGLSNKVVLNAELEADRGRLRERLLDAAPRWLTLIATVDDARFGVNIIPYTLAHTTWGDLGPGDLVNLEVDLLARYVARLRE